MGCFLIRNFAAFLNLNLIAMLGVVTELSLFVTDWWEAGGVGCLHEIWYVAKVKPLIVVNESLSEAAPKPLKHNMFP